MHRREVDLRDNAVFMLYLTEAWRLDGWTNPTPPKKMNIGLYSNSLVEQLERQNRELRLVEDEEHTS